MLNELIPENVGAIEVTKVKHVQRKKKRDQKEHRGPHVEEGIEESNDKQGEDRGGDTGKGERHERRGIYSS